MSDDDPIEDVVAHRVGTGPRSPLLLYEKRDVHIWIVSDFWLHRDECL